MKKEIQGRLGKAQELLLAKKKISNQTPNYSQITVVFQEQSWSSVLFGGGKPLAQCPKIRIMVSNKIALFQLSKQVRKSFKISEKDTFHFFRQGKMVNATQTVGQLRNKGEVIELVALCMEVY